MPELGSISILIDDLRRGDDEAVRKLWERFFEPLTTFAKSKLPARNRKVVDEEDIASHAIHSFQKAVREGKYPSLNNRDEIWRFLVKIAGRNSIDQIRRQTAEKRGGGNCRGESAFAKLGETRGLELLGGSKNPVESVVDFVDQLDSLLCKLNDKVLKQVLLARLAGDSVELIAQQLDMSVVSVNRKLNIVHQIWQATDSD